MLILPYSVRKCFRKHEFDKAPVRIIDESGDLYRLMPDGSVYVHWKQEGGIPYTKDGGLLGKMKRGI